MYCNHCGASVDKNARFCSVCGTATTLQVGLQNESIEKSYAVDTPKTLEYISTEDLARKSRDATQAMIFGIIGAALALEAGIPGIILGAIGLNKANKYVEKYGETCAKVKLGHCLSKVGIIAGIAIGVLTLYIFSIYGLSLLSLFVNT